MKRLLVVGAGKFQCKGIQRAKELGYWVIATDGNKLAPGKDIADKFEHLDILDIESHIKLAKESNIDGVISFSTEAPLETVTAVANFLNLTSISDNDVKFSKSKIFQRELALTNNVLVPKRETIKSHDDITIPFPIIIKPIDSAGGRGISVLHNNENISDAITKALNNSKKEEVIVEEFLVGTEITVEGFVYDGKHKVLALSTKEKFDQNPTIASRIFYRNDFVKEDKEYIEGSLAKIITKLGTSYGATHTEFIHVPSKGIYFIESSIRGGGFNIFSSAIKNCTEYDILEAHINYALNILPEEPKSIEDKCCLIEFLFPKEGTIKSIELPDINDNVDIDIFLNVGDKIQSLDWDGSRIGTITITSNTVESAVNELKSVLDRSTILVD